MLERNTYSPGSLPYGLLRLWIPSYKHGINLTNNTLGTRDYTIF